MDVLEPTINTPLSVSKKKAVIAHTSAELKKTIEHTPAKNDWSWLNSASVEDIAQFMKDNGRFGKGIGRMTSPEGKLASASTFYQALRKSTYWDAIKDDSIVYKQVFGIDKKENKRLWIESGSIDDVAQFMKDNGRHGKGPGWMSSNEGTLSGAYAFYGALIKSIHWNSIRNNSIIYKQVFGVNKKEKQDWSWVKSASVDDITTFIKDNGRHGKGISWIRSFSKGNSFCKRLRKNKNRNNIKNNPIIYKQVFGVDKKEKQDWSRLNSSSSDVVSKYIKDKGRFGKGPGWMKSDEGIRLGAREFYGALIKSNIRENIKDDLNIYKQVFGINKIIEENRSRLDSASIDDIVKFMKNKGRWGKGVYWMKSTEGQLSGAYRFYGALTRKSILQSILNDSTSYERFFGVKQRSDRSRLDSTSIDDITTFIKDKGRFGKGVYWMQSSKGQLSGAYAFYVALRTKSIRNSILNNANIYKKIFGVDKITDWSWIESASIDDIAQFMKDRGRFGKGSGWIGSSEGQLSGAYAFYGALQRKSIRQSIVNDSTSYKKIFGKSPYQRLYHDNTIDIGFDSLEERRIAIILYKLGIVEKWEEGKNLHIRTNGSAKNSIDFKIGDTFLEYHPYNGHRKKHKGGSFIEEAQRKYDHITNPRYKDKLDLIVFDHKVDYYDKKSHTWKQRTDLCRSLFNIIIETPSLISRIPLGKRYIMLDYTRFKEFYHQIAKELSDYDIQSTEEQNKD